MLEDQKKIYMLQYPNSHQLEPEVNDIKTLTVTVTVRLLALSVISA